MAKLCTNETTTARQRWIENGLLELMQERKFEDVTVTDLCRHLNLSRRSFYRYFDNMEDVLDCLLDHPACLVIPVHCLRPSKMFVVFQAQIHLEALRL